MELNLSRQAKLIPEDIMGTNIKVFGVGSVGSHVVRILAKTGFTNISVYDMDIVEDENISAQAFDFTHLKKNKVEAIKELVLRESGVEVEANHGQIVVGSTISPEPNTVYCCFFDSFEARKMLYDMLKDYPIVFVDARIGMFDMRHYLVDCSDKEQVATFDKTLTTGKVSELACGEKACAPVNNIISGMVVMNIINYLKGLSYTKTYIGNAQSTQAVINVIHEVKQID